MDYDYRLVRRSKDARKTEYTSNSVSTSKYTIWSFLPMCIFNEFRRTSNMYFLIIAILQSIEAISPISPVTAIAPLAFVVCLSIGKEGMEDHSRYLSDKTVNKKKIQSYRNDKPEMVSWEDVVVGDLIQVFDNEQMPADLVLLASSVPKSSCYIDTCNLDGEITLKARQALAATAKFKSLSDCAGKEFEVKCEQPDEDTYKFNGAMLTNQEAKQLDENQFLPRGTTLKNTPWVIGIVVYTGHETKVMQNIRRRHFKISQVQLLVNQIVVYVFILQILLCAIAAVAHVIWMNKLYSTSKFDYEERHLGALNMYSTWILVFLNYVVMLNTFIPISLVVAIEFVKVFHAMFVRWDNEMRTPDQAGAHCSTSSLMDELGQINYIFSDKTGTLTKNSMEFQKCFVNGKTYREVPKQEIRAEHHDVLDGSYHEIAAYQHRCKSQRTLSLEAIDDSEPISALRKLCAEKEGMEREFVFSMAICHTVVATHDTANNTIHYTGDSPDEYALVNGARRLGVSFLGLKDQQIKLEIPVPTENGAYEPRLFECKLLQVLPFNSFRKSMSVIIQLPTGAIKLISKGADAVILSRCADQKSEGIVKMHKIVHQFAVEGLRTLCYATRTLNPDTYAAWSKRYEAAHVSIKNRDENMSMVMQQIEKDMIPLGATAIEDKLQDFVPQTIERLGTAGIKIWVLTGDKHETAVEIGKACNIIRPNMEEVFMFTSSTTTEFNRLLKDSVAIISNREGPFGLVVEGEALTRALLPPHRADFLQLALACSAVIVARCSPLQKAMVVELVQEGTKAITMAVGDGANDVSMIQAANVGIGIVGQEGMQAVRTSDYAIQQFSHLDRLLLYHGRLSYLRITQCINYFFYKNIASTVPHFLLGMFTNFAGRTFFDEMYISGFNVVFTVFPVVMRAITERDIDDCLAALYPQTYLIGANNALFSIWTVFIELIRGLAHAIILCAIPGYLYLGYQFERGGTGVDVYSTGVAVYTAIVLVVTLDIAIRTRYFTMTVIYGLLGSILLYFGFAMNYDAAPSPIQGALSLILYDPLFVHITILGCVTCFLPILCIMGYNENFRANLNPVDVLRRAPQQEIVTSVADEK